MATSRRRYYIWLIKAYVKKMKRTILSSLILGILIFFAVAGVLNFYLRPLFEKKTETIGYWGAYTAETIPEKILFDVSYGLTRVDAGGNITSGAAEKWEIQDNGKIYIFHLKKGLRFQNKEELTAKNVPYEFEDVQRKVLNPYTIEFILKDPYSPFLSSVAKPMLIKNFSGLGEYRIRDVEFNAGFIKNILLQKMTDSGTKKSISFYPTQKALKVALMLGEVNEARELTSTDLGSTEVKSWKNLKTQSNIDYGTMVALFYNNNDEIFYNNKKFRQTLNYALPVTTRYGERAFSPIPPISIYFEKSPNYGIADIEIAKTLLASVKDPIKKPLEISTFEEYKDAAHEVASAWEKIGIKSKITIVDAIPPNFQILLYRYKLPKDPDQYVLWHKAQKNNIAHYDSNRIDKLLEDGRSIVEIEKRKKIYADFQKYLTDDVPASFYYFPRTFTLTKN